MNPRAPYAWIAILMVLLVSVSGCGQANTSSGDVTQTAQAERTLTLTCYTAYRSSATVAIEQEEEIMLGPNDDHRTITFSDLTFEAHYSAGAAEWEEQGLNVRVRAADTGEELTSTLYQISKTEGIRNQFVGGHGFTGLSYVYHPLSRAELQYWCRVQ